jgi:type I restriction enzyme R subunit
VLDFFNKVEDIKASFDPFYTATILNSATDVNVLHELKDLLDNIGVYEQEEIENFNEKYFNGVDASELSPIIDTSAHRFNNELELEDEQKADYKIKAKQFVKIYAQMASIMPYEIQNWEKLFWFIKFLIPKLIIEDKNQDMLDDLLNSVDLSTYGLERVKLNTTILLDDKETELEPQNPNPRGAYGIDEDKDPLDEIINNFNERWYQKWNATPEEQRVRFINMAQKMKEHPDFESKYVQNSDSHTRNLAYVKIFDEVMNKQRRSELELYKILSQDDTFKNAMQDTIKRFINIEL